MVHVAACQLADRVAAAGIVSGFAADPQAGCRPSRPMPVIAFLTGPDLGGELLPIPDWLLERLMNVRLEQAAPLPPSPQAWAEAWAERDACEGPVTSETLAPGVTRERYTGCAQEAEVVLVSVPAMGHAWPGGPALPGLGENTDAVDATRLMWEFFSRHPRR
jgi:polyhydroxybutyrate depolymerase